jgi:large subunit ribosomal protein L30
LQGGLSDRTKAKSAAGGELLVVNLRGIVNTRSPVRTTLDQLGILKRFSATVVPDSPEFLGMLRLVKNNVAWCAADMATIDTLQKKRGGIIEGETAKDSKTPSAQPAHRVYRLNSPKGGFKRSIRRQYGQGGTLGPNPKLPELVSAML